MADLRHQGRLTATGNIVVQTVFMEIFGVNTVRISSKSATSCDAARLRVASVVDVTGSMPDTVS